MKQKLIGLLDVDKLLRVAHIIFWTSSLLLLCRTLVRLIAPDALIRVVGDSTGYQLTASQAYSLPDARYGIPISPDFAAALTDSFTSVPVFWWLDIALAGAMVIAAYCITVMILPSAARLRKKFPIEFLTTESPSSLVGNLVLQFRLRARKLKLTARISLLLILFSLYGGFTLFLRAEETSANVTSRIASSLYKSWESTQIELARINNELNLLTDPSDVNRARQSVRERLENPKGKKIEEAQVDSYLAARAIYLNEQRDRFEKRIVELEDRVKKAQEQKQEGSERDQTQFIVSVVSKRVGAVLILIFLVQILVTLFRYNSRLAAFYDARADALQVCTSNAFDSAEKCVAVLAPDSLDFGKIPRSSVESGAEIVKRLLGSQERIKT